MNSNIVNNLSLENTGNIDIKRLNKNQYTISLMIEGVKTGLLSNADIVNIQVELMDLLKALILRYTKGESTSTTVEAAEGLLNSLLYAIDFYMLKLDNPKAALMELKQKHLKEIYEEGLQLLRLCVVDTKKLYGKIKKNRLKVELEAYNLTIDEAIPCFFEKYTIVFQAHNAMASIDYPLVFDDMGVRGISYIKNYLEHLDIETEFCRHFTDEDINKILNGFGKMCRLNHKIELINIFELVMNNSIFSVMCENMPSRLSIIDYQYRIIDKRLKLGDSSSINILIDNAVDTIITDFKINNPLLIDYINNYKDLFKGRLLNALENDCLNSMVVIEKEYEKKYTFAFDEGKRMDEKSFRLIIDKLTSLTDVEKKVDIINANVHSLQDFIDILNSDCIFEEEFEYIFNILSDLELTILTKVVFYEKIRDGLTDLSVMIAGKGEIEAEWKRYFIDFVKSLSQYKRKKVEELLNEVDYEEISFY